MDGRDRLEAYHELKKLVTEAWDKELDRLILEVYKENGYGAFLGEILVEEQRYNQLYDRLLVMDSDPIDEILKYRKYFTKEQISALAMRMGHFIKCPLNTYRANRKGYRHIARHIGQVASLGAMGKKVAASTVDYLLSTYSNRPALRDELQKAQLC